MKKTKQTRLNNQRQRQKLNLSKETIGERQERLEKCNASKKSVRIEEIKFIHKLKKEFK